MEASRIYVVYHPEFDKKEFKKLNNMVKENGEKFNFFTGVDLYPELNVTEDDILKEKIYEIMDKADVLLVLLSKKVKSMRKFVKWQIEYATKTGIPTIAMNNSVLRSIDLSITPTLLKKKLCLFIPYDSKVLELASINWKDSYQAHFENGDKLQYRYDKKVYDQLYLEEEIV